MPAATRIAAVRYGDGSLRRDAKLRAVALLWLFGPLIWILGGVFLLTLAAPSAASAAWQHVSPVPSQSQPYFVCPAQGHRPRCGLIEDPTRGSGRRGPVAAGALTKGPVQEASPAFYGSGVEGGYAPEDLRAAYDMPSSYAGAGQTVAIVDAYDDPDAESDLARYRFEYGLPACTASSGCLRKVDEAGGTKYPAGNAEWAREISLDLDMVSAICPNCHLLLVEASSNEGARLAAAEKRATELGATEISNSYAQETPPETRHAAEEYDQAYDHPRTPTTASGGDHGYGVVWPAANPNVISVGGTTLKPAAGRGGWTETVWSNPGGKLSGTGSGCSGEPKPSWQKDKLCAGRTTNDVAAVADPNTPVSVYDSYETSAPHWLLLGGTSVGAPIVAAEMALASAYTRSFDGADGLYIQYANSAAGFYDIVSGRTPGCAEGNLLCEAALGYDGPTGLGSLRGAPEVPAPTPATGSASAITQGTATLEGTLNPHGGHLSECRFEYGPTTSYGSSVPCSSLGGASTIPVGVTASVAGLSPESAYHFRIVAVFTGGSATGEDDSFTTLGPPPSIVPEAPSDLAQSSVTLNALVNPDGELVGECAFQYGTTTSYGQSAPCDQSPGSGEDPVAVSASLAGLTANRTYHFRVVATSPQGTGYSSDQTLTTLPEAPIAVSDPPSYLAPTSATLNATVNPNDAPVTSCEFEFNSSATYVPCSTTLGTGETAVAVSAPVINLRPKTTYSYRIVAGNTGGTSYGAIQTLTTPASSATGQGTPFSGAKLADTTLLVSPSGKLTARVECPAGDSSCPGTISLRTAAAVATGASHAERILTLASGSFRIGTGRVAAVALRLSAAARRLLAGRRSLRVVAALVTRQPARPTQSWRAAVTLLARQR